MRCEYSEVVGLVHKLHQTIREDRGEESSVRIWGVPRGGTIVALLLQAYYPIYECSTTYGDSDIIVDDILDTGVTKSAHAKPFYVLLDKRVHNINEPVIFPWEDDELAYPLDLCKRIQETNFANYDPEQMIQAILMMTSAINSMMLVLSNEPNFSVQVSLGSSPIEMLQINAFKRISL